MKRKDLRVGKIYKAKVAIRGLNDLNQDLIVPPNTQLTYRGGARGRRFRFGIGSPEIIDLLERDLWLLELVLDPFPDP